MAETMSNVDHFWLCMDESTNLMTISGLMEFDEPLNMERLYDTISNRLLCFNRFKQRVKKKGLGSPVWEEDPYFDIRNHIHRVALPAPGDKKALQEMISALMATPFDMSRPLWKMYVIENFGGGSVVFANIHHCIADGIALIYVLLSTTDTNPDAKATDAGFIEGPGKDNLPSKQRRTGKNTRFGLLKTARKLTNRTIRGTANAITNPDGVVSNLRRFTELASDTVGVIGHLATMPRHPENSFRGDLGVRKTVAWTDPMPIGHIKTVGKAVDATLNDVLIATVTGALRRYLAKQNDRVNELDLKVTVPVNIRKQGTEFELGNKFSLVWLGLPVYIEDPVLRLREVKRRMDKLKRSPEVFVTFSALNMLGMTPAGVATRAAQFFANKATSVLTNVPGPQQPLYFAGTQISNMMFWVPRIGKIGLGISIFSYNGKVTVGLASDENLVPDPEALLEGFEEDFNYLLNLVNTGKIDGEPLVLHDRYEEARIEHKKTGEDRETTYMELWPTRYFSESGSGENAEEEATSEDDPAAVPFSSETSPQEESEQEAKEMDI